MKETVQQATVLFRDYTSKMKNDKTLSPIFREKNNVGFVLSNFTVETKRILEYYIRCMTVLNRNYDKLSEYQKKCIFLISWYFQKWVNSLHQRDYEEVRYLLRQMTRISELKEDKRVDKIYELVTEIY